jgi:hypothetical protein
MALIDQPIRTILKAHSTQIAAAGAAAEIALQYFIGSGMPWYVIVGLFAAVILGRAVKQPALSGEKTEADDDAAIGI